MSRLGKNPITIPSNVTVTQNGIDLTVKGPHGELSRSFRDDVVGVAIEGDKITVTPKGESKFARSLWGTHASHIKNMIKGVTEQFSKELIVEGVGFRVELAGDKLVMNLGFSHKVEVVIPADIKVEVEKNNIKITGPNKETVGKFAADIRAYKKPEPYKGKGIRYSDEVIKRKEGKKTA